ncbi:ankyrin repeat domain-containing protein [Brevibacillus sp. LEMMJ03]|uniref:ankyrin repeat domain-containing protein n=1 Tax=Brevibacillus sp. LEMMJ03 TaxID=2595056 RepID=UPI00117E96D1|nr:ankyrin repeat domain-containing protein [Brevibacillus sp. LEMMJ03]TRY27329.1 ankyrin repeat domain-containing protein [Brevibacillus sp. LEMMJ03]
MSKREDIMQAAMNGDAKSVQACLAADGSLAGAYSEDGWTALHLVAYFGHLEAALVLLDHGADPEVRSRNRMENTPLHAAVANRQVAAARLLLERGADVNAVQSGGWTALHEAAMLGDAGMVTLLLERGADRAAQKDDGLTPLDLARENGHDAVIALLPGQADGNG